jgi:perosamine synthetase
MPTVQTRERDIPFFRPELTTAEIDEVVDTLRSGWLTTGPKVARFEEAFAAAVGGRHAIALNSCTAALHVAVEALGLAPGDGVLVPTMTFAATAEVVRYQNAEPVLVDADPETGNIDLEDAALKHDAWNRLHPNQRIVGIMPVHVGGLMVDLAALHTFASDRGLWIVEDAAHAFPAAWRASADQSWRRCGENTADVTCFSFYANKTITTGEGGMAVTADETLASRMRLMSLHGLSHDAWKRYTAGGSWDYRIVAPGFKYNLTDIAAAIGIHQVARAESLREAREAAAARYRRLLGDCDAVELPPIVPDRIHAHHLFPIRLRRERLTCDRDTFISELRARGVTCTVHWRPLHLHPYYQETFSVGPETCPAATGLFGRLISLPLFPGLSNEELEYVASAVKEIAASHAR